MNEANNNVRQLGIIAGRGMYPIVLAQSARAQGVERIDVVAFKGETSRAIEVYADTVHWLRVGQLEKLLNLVKACGLSQVVMAGQIAPRNLFHARLDKRMLGILRSLPAWNAHTIFGAVADELRGVGAELMPAGLYMQSAMPAPGVLTARGPTPSEEKDIALGLQVARWSSHYEVGQTVVVKNGVVLAVEAFEGTDKAILRAGQLGGDGLVVVKLAKPGHDMRFDIPVVGLKTLKMLKRAGATALALEAGRSIVLETERVVQQADRQNLAIRIFNKEELIRHDDQPED
ncbi:MAG: UDP-2,3-diacylglucosamine diphosphatase LpxI [Kiritimatiellae bacterium]|nr:UDP-2,3-diacylglucosamine diphosphatase LpxI [Kiritimatiellia bacterium]